MSHRLISLTSKTAAVALTALTLAASLAATSQRAEAKGAGIGFGIAAGLIGAAAVGAAVTSGGVYDDGYDGYRRCGWIRQYDAYGNYIGRVRSCG